MGGILTKLAGTSLLLGIVLGGALPTFAQEERPQPRRAGDRPPNRPDRPERVEDPPRDGRDPRDRGSRDPGGLEGLERIAGRLNLSPDQRVQWDALLKNMREQAEQPGGHADLIRRMRVARRTGDDARVEEIRAQLREGGAAARPVQKFLDQAETFLDDRQKQQLGELVARMREGRSGDVMDRIRGLSEKLNLNEDQQARFDEKLAELEQLHRQRRPADDARPRPAGDPEMSDPPATEDGDAPAPPAARRGPARGNPARGPDPAVGRFLDEIAEMLNEDQRRILDDERPRLTPPPGGEREGLGRIRSALRRLDLTQEQGEQARAIQRDAEEQFRKLAEDADGRAKLTTETTDRIREILTPEQLREFNRALERPQRPARGDRRQRRPEAP